MSDLIEILLYTLLSGLMIPLGGYLSTFENVFPQWLESELRHSIIAFGGGCLLSAVSLVLIPEASKNLNLIEMCISFAIGGLFFHFLDKFLSKAGGSSSNLIAMLSDFIPESLALGATFIIHKKTGLLLAVLIGFQNLPEAYNSFREIKSVSNTSNKKIVLNFFLCALIGPLCGYIGYTFLSEMEKVLSFIMMFTASGILYLLFQDIAPMSKLNKAWAPALGANLGFLIGLIGEKLT